MKKRILAGILVIVTVFSLCCCAAPGENPTTDPETNPSQTESTGSTETSQTTDTSESQDSTQGTENTEPPLPEKEPLVQLGQIHITTNGSIYDEYSAAIVTAQWVGGGVVNQTVQIRHRGYTSNSTEKKSYNIKFEDKVDLMGMEEGKKWTLLGNPFDKSLLRIVVGFDFAADIGIPYASQAKLCKLWLNGVYKGIYVAIEPVDAKKGRVDIDTKTGAFIVERNNTREEDGVTYIKTNAGIRYEMSDPDEPNAAQTAAALEILNHVEKEVQSLDHTRYEKVIDVASFVDFYIFEELVKDIDFARFSTRYYYSEGLLYAGPPWDLDLSQGNTSGVYGEIVYKKYYNRDGYGDGSGDSASGFWAQKDYYQWLCKDPYFMDLVKTRWAEVSVLAHNLYEDNERGTNRIDEYLAAYQKDLESNYSKDGSHWPLGWPLGVLEYHDPANDLEGNVELYRSWLRRRVTWLDTALAVE